MGPSASPNHEVGLGDLKGWQGFGRVGWLGGARLLLLLVAPALAPGSCSWGAAPPTLKLDPVGFLTVSELGSSSFRIQSQAIVSEDSQVSEPTPF